jgi:hypothetical protein
MAGLSLLFLFGYVIADDLTRDGQAHVYQDPIYFSVASGMLYVFMFLVSVLGLVGAWRQSLSLVTAYLMGLIVATIAKVIMSLGLSIWIKTVLPNMLEKNGCFSRQEGLVGEPWTQKQCHSYRTEAMAAAWFWVFPVLLCAAYICCAAWLRNLLNTVDDAARAQWSRQQYSEMTSMRGVAPVAILPLPGGESGLVPQGEVEVVMGQPAAHLGSDSPRLPGMFGKLEGGGFNADKNNTRIMKEFGGASSADEAVSSSGPEPSLSPEVTTAESSRHPNPLVGMAGERNPPPPLPPPVESNGKGKQELVEIDISDVLMSECAQELAENLPPPGKLPKEEL